MVADDALIQLFHTHGAVRRYDAGDRILNAGDHPSAVFLVRSGAVKVSVVARSGRESLLEVREPGALLGEMSAILGGGRSAAADGLVPGELLRVPIAEFRRELDNPEFAKALLVETARRLRTASLHQHEIAAGTARSRIARVLADLAGRIGVVDGDEVHLGALSQQDIADFAGVSRDSAVRTLGEFRRAGWVSTGRRRLVLRDVAALGQIAEV
ncbi:MAG: Crp/Fnr family transcriptional regulator [Actinomycetota bacterium]